MEPYRYFKYRQINKYFIDSLVKGTIYFAQPDQLNDPFDCRVDIKGSIMNAAESVTRDRAEELKNLLEQADFFGRLQNKIDQVGICSFSLDIENTVVWAHYADNHRGLCVLYEFPGKFFIDKKDEIIGVSKVAYRNDNVKRWFIELSKKLPADFNEYGIDLAKVLLTAKSPSWACENEARIIRNKPGPFNIPISFIKQICFGLQTPDNDILLVKELTKNYKDKITFCRVKKDRSDFGIGIEEI